MKLNGADFRAVGAPHTSRTNHELTQGSRGNISSKKRQEFSQRNQTLSNLGSSYFHFRRVAFSSILKAKCGLILAKTADLRINLNLDGEPITSQSHTPPLENSQTSRLLTSSLSLGVPVPRPTQCLRDV